MLRKSNSRKWRSTASGMPIPNASPTGQIIEELTLNITIAEDAAMGKREMRVITPAGISNPIWFFVDQWEERRETEPNDDQPDPVIGSTLPVVVNGQIMPGDVDRFAFTGRKGTRLVINAAARDLMPYLADAVPGWFQAVLALYDANGKQLAYAGAYHYRQDPVIYYEIPEDGEYSFEIRDSIYRGREDFVYRVTLGELPFVTGIFPLGGRAGTDVAVELQGWNLVETQLNIHASFNRNRPIRWYSIPQNDKVDIRFPLAHRHADRGPRPGTERQPGDSPGSQHALYHQRPHRTKPTTAMCSSSTATECSRRKCSHAAEVSPLDSALTLIDSDGKEIGFNDDYKDEAQPLITHHADSLLKAGLLGKGPFYLHLADAQRKGGEDFIYRLYIRRPVADFDLRVVPSSIIARPGAHVPITVHAIRRGGYDDEIELSLVEPPEGFSLIGAKVPPGEKKVQLTLTVPPEALSEHVTLEMDGLSPGNRRQRKFSRPVVPAEDMMQAFLWTQLVTAEQWTVVVSGKPIPPIPLQFPPEPIKLKLGRVDGGRRTSGGQDTTEPTRPLSNCTIRPRAFASRRSLRSRGACPSSIIVDAELAKAGMKGQPDLRSLSPVHAGSHREQPQASRAADGPTATCRRFRSRWKRRGGSRRLVCQIRRIRPSSQRMRAR